MTEYDFSDLSDFSTDFTTDQQATSDPAGDAAVNNNAAIVVVDSDDSVRGYLATLFDNVVHASSVGEVEGLAGGQPTVAVLGPSCANPEELDAAAAWASGAPHIGSILITTDPALDLVQKALNVGINDVLAAPIDENLLAETVQRVSGGLAGTSGGASTLGADSPSLGGAISGGGGAAPQEPESPFDQSVFESTKMGRVISVFSTKGGSGKSITAANLAVLLAQSSPDPVVLIDGHLQFGDQEVMLKVHAEHTVVDAIEQIDKADPSFIQQLLTVHEATGLHVLPAPREPTFADQIEGPQLRRLIKLCQTFAGHVVVDLPAIFTEVVIGALEQSNDIVLVAGLDLPNIKNMKIGLRTLEMLNIDKDSIHLVLNRADSKVKLDIGEVERTLGATAVVHVPSDVVVPISVNKGSPVVLSAPKSGVARAFAELAGRFVANVNVPTASSGGRRRFFG